MCLLIDKTQPNTYVNNYLLLICQPMLYICWLNERCITCAMWYRPVSPAASKHIIISCHGNTDEAARHTWQRQQGGWWHRQDVTQSACAAAATAAEIVDSCFPPYLYWSCQTSAHSQHHSNTPRSVLHHLIPVVFKSTYFYLIS